MLSVKLLPSNSEILKLQYVEESNLENLIVVCPSPQKADGIRSHLLGLGISADVVTISKFIKDCLATLEEVPTVSRKSELLLKLSTIWRIKFPEVEYDIFTKAFNLYTELRGFSLNLELLEEVLQEEEESLATAIRFFWLISEELNLVDEHQAYGFLSEEIRSGESPTHELIDNKPIVFMGFKHLSGGQLDLLKAVGIRTQVTIPVHQQVFKSAESTTWLGWLEVKDENIEEEITAKEIPVFRFKKGRFSEESYKELNAILSKGADLYLPSNNQDFQNLNILPVEDLFYKASVDPFKPILTSFVNELKTYCDFGNEIINDQDIEELIASFDELSIKKDFYFRWLKVKSLFLRLLDEWKELSDANKELTFFDTEVFFEILDLDLPRNYLIPIFDKEPLNTINSLDSAELNSAENIVLIGGSFLGPLKSGEANFSEVQMESLTSLGPLRSSELDFVTKKVAFKELVAATNPTLFLEDKIEEVDIAWLELLDGYTLDDKKLSPHEVSKSNIIEDNTNRAENNLEKVSSTALQAYIDCPQKYYYKYLEKIEVNPKIEEGLRPYQLGIIQHAVIGQYIEQKSDDLKELSAKALNKLLAKEGIQINPVQYQEALLEIIHYSQRGIDFVNTFEKMIGSGEREFEKPFSEVIDGITHRGDVDYFYGVSDGFAFVDFKRSQSGIPPVGEFKAFKKIQAWYYLNHIGEDKENLLLFGYFNLSDPSKSLLYTPIKEMVAEFKAQGIKVSHLNKIEELNSDYEKLEEETLISLTKEKEFSASPADKTVCSYCSVKYICERGTL